MAFSAVGFAFARTSAVCGAVGIAGPLTRHAPGVRVAATFTAATAIARARSLDIGVALTRALRIELRRARRLKRNGAALCVAVDLGNDFAFRVSGNVDLATAVDNVCGGGKRNECAGGNRKSAEYLMKFHSGFSLASKGWQCGRWESSTKER